MLYIRDAPGGSTTIFCVVDERRHFGHYMWAEALFERVVYLYLSTTTTSIGLTVLGRHRLVSGGGVLYSAATIESGIRIELA